MGIKRQRSGDPAAQSVVQHKVQGAQMRQLVALHRAVNDGAQV